MTEDAVREAWEDIIEYRCPSRVSQNANSHDGVGACCFPQGRTTDCCYENCPITLPPMLSRQRMSGEELWERQREECSRSMDHDLCGHCEKFPLCREYINGFKAGQEKQSA